MMKYDMVSQIYLLEIEQWRTKKAELAGLNRDYHMKKTIGQGVQPPKLMNNLFLVDQVQ